MQIRPLRPRAGKGPAKGTEKGLHIRTRQVFKIHLGPEAGSPDLRTVVLLLDVFFAKQGLSASGVPCAVPGATRQWAETDLALTPGVHHPEMSGWKRSVLVR